VFLVICLGTFWWAVRPSAAGQRHTILVFTWLCSAIAATLVIFSAFPASTAEGSLFGVTLGGAGAFVMLVWTAAVRASHTAGGRDALEARLLQRDRQITELQELVARLTHRPKPVISSERFLYRLLSPATRDERSIGIVTGDLRRAHCARVWVSPENTNMNMADALDDSISGLVRYEGARRDALGHVVEDLIVDELNRKIAGRRPLPPGTAVVTSAGALSRNGVHWIVHVAAVFGQQGEGYQQIRDVARCATNALAAVDTINDPLRPDSILFPLLGTGHGGGDVETTVRTLVHAVIDYLTANPASPIRVVYFLAYTDDELAVCRRVFRETRRLKPLARPARHPS
jgi:O-acetyl-ADP-ribose deacetylase (regulator of RNase III)